jgi:hypothetical protein
LKKTIFIIFFAGLSAFTFSQDNNTSLKKEIVAVDIGLLGIWINYERHLGRLFTLKSTLGLEFGFGNINGFVPDGYPNNYYAFTPSVRVEPRYYYSFNRRVNLGKKTSYNASNYFAFTATYIPNLFTISNVPDLGVQSGVSLIPKWGIKRTIGQRVNFEFAFGFGVVHFFDSAVTEAGFGLDLRFGYNIK